jgi:hypothetical protein
MSFLKRLFGAGSAPAAGPAKPAAEMEHRGFTILAEPYPAEGGQFQTAGTILKVIDGVTREHRFVRADRFGSLDAAADMALSKGRQIIDEQGDRLFPPEAAGS